MESRSLSLQTYARVGGILFLVSIIAGGFGEAIAPSSIVVSGNAAATAQHILASNQFFRAGFAGYLVESACDVALAAVLYLLLRPVNAGIALFGAFFHLLATATFATAELFYFAPALMLQGDGYLKSFTPDQLNSLALLSLNLYSAGGNLYQIHYGLGSIFFGYLMFQSGYVPRALGALLLAGGVGFVLQSFLFVFAPQFPSMVLALPMILTLVLLGIWLTVRGIDTPKLQIRLALATS